MAHYQVFWQKGDKEPPLSSHWYTLNGFVVWASPQLRDWTGALHRDLVVALYRGHTPFAGVQSRSRYPVLLDDHCVPPTLKYHKQLMQCLKALLKEEP